MYDWEDSLGYVSQNLHKMVAGAGIEPTTPRL